jgi:hypothetical protein
LSAAARLSAFAALLALVFAVAAYAGDRVGWTPRDGDDASTGGHATMSQGTPGEAVPGLAVSQDGLTLELDRTSVERGVGSPFTFRIAGDHGRPVRDFDVEQEKRMHFIVVRRDLTGFQHLHPTQGRDGAWRVPLRVTDPGSYRVFADFATRGAKHTLGADVTVDGTAVARRPPPASSTAMVDGYRVTLDRRAGHAGRESELRFSVSRDGRPVAVDRYLGARGHLVALREGDLAFLHVHLDADALAFTTELPSAGRYRLFLQFRHGGRIHAAAFTQDVTS